MMKDLFHRLTSRKLLIALIGIAYGYYYNQPEIVQLSILGYLGAEGLGDAAGRLPAKPAPVINSPGAANQNSTTDVFDKVDDDDDDDRQIVPGN